MDGQSREATRAVSARPGGDGPRRGAMRRGPHGGFGRLAPPRRVRLWCWLALGLALLPLLYRRPGERKHFDHLVNRPLPAAELRLPDGRAAPALGLLGPRGGVFVFLGTQCPVSNQYLPTLKALAGECRDRGVAVVGVNANASETPEQVAEHVREFGVTFPVAKDPEGAAAERWRVGRTNEALLVDGRGVLRYRGAIDDELRPGLRRGAPTRPLLRLAIDAMLAGRPIEEPVTTAYGCPIEWPAQAPGRRTAPRVRAAAPAIVAAREEAAPAVEVGAVTYAGDVAPILAEKCQACHRPRQVAPFALLGYRDARRWAAGIAEVVEDYRMPPWHADPRFGRFENDRSLTPRQRAVLLAWVEQGCPPGDPAREPPPREFPEGWSIGTPDAIYTMPEPFEVPARGTVAIQRFRVPSGLAEDRWVQKVEMQPGVRSVVHHMFVFIEPHRDSPADLLKTGPTLVAYAPGDAPSIYPPGIARRIPAGSDLMFEVHYTPDGRTRFDRSSVGLIFAREPVRHQAVFKGIPDKTLDIPPGEPNYPARSSYTFPRAVHLLSLMPHMHLRGKDFRYDIVSPGGRRETLLSVPAYDFGWQSVYRLAEPLAVPAGARLECFAHFDNSAANPANPDPRARVRWGDLTTDEMMIGYIDYYEDRPERGPLAGGAIVRSGR